MSYKIVDQIAKSQLASTLKRVLIGYTTFANRDGTGIRPTEAAVGKRAGTSARTVSRHTQALTALGILVHDIDEHGIWLKHAYGDNGVWAYCYHIDASKLTDRALVEQWEADNVALLEKRRAAGAKNTKTRWAKGISGNPSGQSKLSWQEQSKLSITPAEQIGVPLPEQIGVPRSRANCLTDPTPGIPVPKADPSAVSTAVSQNQVSELVSEVRSVAPLPPKGDTASNTEDKPAYDHDLPLWLSAENLNHEMFPSKPWTDADIELLISLVMELDPGLDHNPNWFYPVIRGAAILQGAWDWNQLHKKGGKLQLFSLAELARALRSTNDRNLLAQMRMHEGCKLCMDECVVAGCRALSHEESPYCAAHMPKARAASEC
jgi:hypothetical protein